MIDKNGIELVVGDKVKDMHGLTGEMVNVSGVEALKFEHKGKILYSFEHKIVPSEIQKV